MRYAPFGFAVQSATSGLIGGSAWKIVRYRFSEWAKGRVTGPKTLADAVSAFGAATKSKLANKAATGAPEDQLRAPLEALIKDLAQLLKLSNTHLVGESTLAHLSTRPDYADDLPDST
jgi:hypothetical protein